MAFGGRDQDGSVGVSLDETCDSKDIRDVLWAFGIYLSFLLCSVQLTCLGWVQGANHRDLNYSRKGLEDNG